MMSMRLQECTSGCRRFVDEGGSPDVFLGGVTRTALSDNQAAAGKVAALGCAHAPRDAALCGSVVLQGLQREHSAVQQICDLELIAGQVHSTAMQCAPVNFGPCLAARYDKPQGYCLLQVFPRGDPEPGGRCLPRGHSGIPRLYRAASCACASASVSATAREGISPSRAARYPRRGRSAGGPGRRRHSLSARGRGTGGCRRH